MVATRCERQTQKLCAASESHTCTTCVEVTAIEYAPLHTRVSPRVMGVDRSATDVRRASRLVARPTCDDAPNTPVKNVPVLYVVHPILHVTHRPYSSQVFVP